MRKLYVFGLLIVPMVFCGVSFAGSELQARKDIAALNKPFTGQQFMDSIYEGDELVVRLFISAKHNLNFTEKIQRHLLQGIPANVLQYFARTGGGGLNMPPNYKQYQLAWFDASDLSGLKGTPLMLAVFVGNENLVRDLVEAGADVNLISKYPASGSMRCDTALSLAVKKGNSSVVRLLLKSGADPAARCDMDIINAAFDHLLFRNSKVDSSNVIAIAKDLDQSIGSSFYMSTLKRFGRL